MPLIDLKTDLKSLKYGADRPGGGNSGQPYIQVDINTVDRGFNRLRMTKFDDGFIRGGAVGAINASIVDTLRIGKWLKDLPKGPLWIAKQVGLQLSNPKLETIKFPTGPGVLGTLGKLANIIQDKLGFGPTRIYNLGINTLAQVPVNAFGRHFDRHGLVPVQSDTTKYLNVARTNNQGTGNNNRLVGLANRFNLGTFNATLIINQPAIPGSSLGVRLPISPVVPPALAIDNYFGGPNSVYGIGRTLISRYDFTRTLTQANTDKTNPNKPEIQFNFVSDLGVGEKAISSYSSDISTEENTIKLAAKRTSVPNLKKYQELKEALDKQRTKTRPSVGIKGVNYTTPNQFGIYSDETVFNKNKSLNTTNDLQNPEFFPSSLANPTYYNGTYAIKVDMPWSEAIREKRVGSGKQDTINLTPIFSNSNRTIGDKITIPGSDPFTINDLVKFRIQALDTNDSGNVIGDWMIFRAYLTQFTDSTDGSWGEIKYAGRGDRFYIYDGFTRKINIGFKAAALSVNEMKPMYQKLNYLMGNLMPDYKNNLMRGPLVRMTVGNWIDGQDGILNNLNYTVPQDSPWEIAINEPTGGEKLLILPHIVEVNMTFTPIGSQTRGVNVISSKSFDTSHIAQNANEVSTNQYITGSIPVGV